MTHSGRPWRWRWAAACVVVLQLASLCDGLPLATTRTPTPTTRTPTPTVNETEVTEAPTETPTETPVTEETEEPESTTAAPTAATVVGTVAPAETEASTTFVCTAEQLATLATLSASNAYLQATCSADGGFAGYVFPVNGVLSYAQMVAMSASEACQVYFQAVLLVETAECEVAGVYVRSTAEAILALALEDDGSYPTESEVSAAIAARVAEYTASSSSSSSTSSSSLSWTMPSVSELQQQLDDDLLINADLQVVGTAYLGSDDGEEDASQQDSSASLSAASAASSTDSSTRLGTSSSLVMPLASVMAMLVLP